MRIARIIEVCRRIFRSYFASDFSDGASLATGDGELEILVSEREDGKLIKPQGVVDCHTSPLLRKVLRQWVGKRVPGVVVSLQAVDHLDSSGVATLIEAFEAMKGYGGRLLLADVGPQARQILSLAGSGRLRGATPLLRDRRVRKRAS